MAKTKKCYISTPIYYASGQPHIGHAYTTILGDFLARFKKQRGYDVFFLSGTDEFGKKIETKAKSLNLSPIEMVSSFSDNFRKLFELLNIDLTRFVRTTEENHQEVVKKVFALLFKKGFIYIDQWQGLYCVDCEEGYTSSSALKKADIAEKINADLSKDPEDQLYCNVGHKISTINEPSYFIKLSEFSDFIKQSLESNNPVVFPESRNKEMLNNFINVGLKDLSITRTSVNWGIDCPLNKSHKIYVWLDALFSYLSSTGFASHDDKNYQEFWNNDDSERIHLIAKEITRFHRIYWVIFLEMLGLKQPTKMISHGWIVDENGNKMSKSLNNVIDPVELVDIFGVDQIRYFLLKEVSLSEDGKVGKRLIQETLNSDLINNFANLVNRLIPMIETRQNSIILPYKQGLEVVDNYLTELAKVPAEFERLVEQNDIRGAIKTLLSISKEYSSVIEITKPWELYKNNQTQELANVLFAGACAVRSVFVLLEPILTIKSKEVYEQMNFTPEQIKLENINNFEQLNNHKINQAKKLFQRVNLTLQIAGEKSESDQKDNNKKQKDKNKKSKSENKKEEVAQVEEVKSDNS
ncbi:methionine--tRNA ligase [Mycoplasma bradburyae]|uniref:Methionine--tRNA ligase n=1 Tax=Mycoplasma bradburyae TaxID=2963128 RepID=A0AAW6HPG0_9MOLU|nr:methionine--tRNA ligase [Mycoplasma bradburyae]MDC4183722.1 methionine--tRNA ligase [Mycoplasma bradburyae]UTS70773.1 methionine--tRNA ligase [Mycoplasma bradburyae]